MLISRLLEQTYKKLFHVQNKTKRGVQSVKDVILNGGIIIISSFLIVWLSVFLYTAFYYAYIPNISYIRPVNLQFKSCDEERGICSFPSALVQLTNKQQILMVGQPYKINLQLEMPESPANKELGMFMVCAELRSRDSFLAGHTCRSTMLHYRSTLLHTLTTFTFSPMMIFGATEEKQNVVLELFDNFEEDQSHPVTIVYVEIQSRHIEFYSANIMINAHLSGLRYLMYHWPILSAIVGVGTNLFFIALVCILSYLHITTYEESEDDAFNYEENEKIKEKQEEEEECEVTNDQSSDTSRSEGSAAFFVIPPTQDYSSDEEPHSSHIEVVK